MSKGRIYRGTVKALMFACAFYMAFQTGRCYGKFEIRGPWIVEAQASGSPGNPLDVECWWERVIINDVLLLCYVCVDSSGREVERICSLSH